MMRGQPHLAEYDSRWPLVFESLRVQLLRVLDGQILDVHHIGSTAVTGLRAKPILDVLVGVDDLTQSLACVPILADLGFEYGPSDETPDRHYFRTSRNGLRTHHLSLAELDSKTFINTLLFRDALRGSPELAREYETLKADLVANHVSGQPFHLGKTDFVCRVLTAYGGRP